MSFITLVLAVAVGTLLQALAVTAINWGLRKYHMRRTVKKLAEALALMSQRYPNDYPPPTEGLN